MMQGCDADLGRLITMCGRCAVCQPPASSTRRQAWVVTQAGKEACAGEKRMPGLRWLHRQKQQHGPKQTVCPGCRRCSYVFTVARLALHIRPGRASALLRCTFCACRSLAWLHVHLLNTRWQLLSPPRHALGFRRRQGGVPCLYYYAA